MICSSREFLSLIMFEEYSENIPDFSFQTTSATPILVITTLTTVLSSFTATTTSTAWTTTTTPVFENDYEEVTMMSEPGVSFTVPSSSTSTPVDYYDEDYGNFFVTNTSSSVKHLVETVGLIRIIQASIGEVDGFVVHHLGFFVLLILVGVFGMITCKGKI